jgi:PKHD-type hydroxylase
MRYNGISNRTAQRTQAIWPYAWQDGIFTDDELAKVNEYCRLLPLNVGIIGTGHYSPEQRRALVNMIKPGPETGWMFDRLNAWTAKMNDEYFGLTLNGYDYIQYSEYTKEDAGHFGWHVDLFWGENPPSDMVEPRKLSMSLLLNEPGRDFDGGEFEFINSNPHKPERVELTRGRAIFFPSYLLHRVRPVFTGVRKSLVIWATGPKFT